MKISTSNLVKPLLILTFFASALFAQSVPPSATQRSTVNPTTRPCTAGVSPQLIYKNGTTDTPYTCGPGGVYIIAPGGSTTVCGGAVGGTCDALVIAGGNNGLVTSTASGAATGVATIGTGLDFTASTLTLKPPTLSVIGGVEAINASTHLWIDAISVFGIPHQSQPALADLSDASSVATLTGSQTLTNKTLTSPNFTAPTISGVPINSLATQTVPINQPCAGTDASGLIIGGTCGGSAGSNGTVYVGASGTQNGVNKSFALASSQAAIQLFKNGQLLQPGVDYTLSGTAIVTTVAPQSTDVLISVVANTGSTVSGTISVPGTTTSGNIVTWNSNVGAALSNGPALVTSNTANAVPLLNASGELPQDMKGCPATAVGGATYTALNTDCYLIITAASTITLPASPIVGKMLRLDNKSASNTVTVTAGGVQIQGCNTTQNTSVNLPAPYYMELIWDGTEWRTGVGTEGCLLTSQLLVNGPATVTNLSSSNIFGTGGATITVNATGAGTGGTAACETSPSYLCNGVSGTVKVITAGVPLAGTIFTVTFPVASLSAKSRTCNVYAAGGATFFSVLQAGTVTFAESNTTLTVSSVGTPLTTGLTGDFKYQCF